MMLTIYSTAYGFHTHPLETVSIVKCRWHWSESFVKSWIFCFSPWILWRL